MPDLSPIRNLSDRFKSNLKTVPSLHETHFGVSEGDLPLTILHPSNLELPGKRVSENLVGSRHRSDNLLDTSQRRFSTLSATHSEVMQSGSGYLPVQYRWGNYYL